MRAIKESGIPLKKNVRLILGSDEETGSIDITKYYFTDALWPDFDQAEFDKALESYSKRERRMGGRLK